MKESYHLFVIYKRMMKEQDKIRQQLNEYSKDVEAIKYKSIKAKPLKQEVELERLLN